MFSKFSEDVQKVLVDANKESNLLKHEYVGSEHLFLSLLNGDNSFSNYMNKYPWVWKNSPWPWEGGN